MGMSSAPTFMNVSLAVDAVLFFIAFFGGVIVSWWALGALKWDKFVNATNISQVNMLRFLLALFGGMLWGSIAILYLLAVEALRGL